MKYQLVQMPTERVLVQGQIDKLFTQMAEIEHQIGGETRNIAYPNATYGDGIQWLIQSLVATEVIKDSTEIDGIVHKLAHGGEDFKQPTLLDDQVITKLTKLYILAPVHLPPAVEGIKVCRGFLPTVPQYGVFETNFHSNIPNYAYLYGLPYEWYEQYGVRKYGFHGTSHQYISQLTAKLLGRDIADLKIISCHLGSGTSVAAIQYGKSVDISSALTPQSGTIMSTRPGDFDPFVFPYIMERTGKTVAEINELMVTSGGLLGISGESGDMRRLEQLAGAGRERAALALDVFCYQVKKYIGAFIAVMNGLDVLIFTGGIGQKSPKIRAKICQGLTYLGIKIDPIKNEQSSRPNCLTHGESNVEVFVVDTNEEIMMARQIYQLYG
jgi:acetate kinase